MQGSYYQTVLLAASSGVSGTVFSTGLINGVLLVNMFKGVLQ